MRLLSLTIIALLLLPLLPAHSQPGTTAEVAGLVFRTLSNEDLDAIQRAINRRVGVEIIEVKPGTPGAAAGYKAGDIVMSVGSTGVDSAEKVVAAIKAGTGTLKLGSVTTVNGEMQAKIYELQVGGATQGGQQQGQGGLGGLNNGGVLGQGQNADAGQPNPNADPISAYFDMMDFVRTQAWGRKVTTPADERQRVAATMQQMWGQMDPQSQAQILAIPQGWAQLQTTWKTASEADRAKQKAQWADALLTPGNLYPPPANPQTFSAEGNAVAFQYPAGWDGGLTEIEGTPYLFLGPEGAPGWQQVFDTPNSPPGALFSIVEVPAELQNVTFVDGARYLAKLLIPNGLQNMRELQVLPIGQVGAVITIAGKFPGQNEEKFFWIGVTQFGQGKVFAGRMGGKVAEADKLIPAFTYLLSTLQLNPPAPPGGGGGGGGGEAMGAWDAAWSRVGAGVVSNIWAPSGN